MKVRKLKEECALLFSVRNALWDSWCQWWDSAGQLGPIYKLFRRARCYLVLIIGSRSLFHHIYYCLASDDNSFTWLESQCHFRYIYPLQMIVNDAISIIYQEQCIIHSMQCNTSPQFENLVSIFLCGKKYPLFVILLHVQLNSQAIRKRERGGGEIDD